jgi:ethanolamine ammonia-lyase small subunit
MSDQKVIDQRHIQEVVKQVLTEVLAQKAPADFQPFAASKPTLKEPAGARHKLADENIARWLGHESSRGSQAGDRRFNFRVPTHSGGRGSIKLRPLKHKDEIVPHKKKAPEGLIDSETPIDRNFIPNPKKPEKLEAILDTTPARIGVWRAGTRYLTKVALKLRADHAVAKDAVYAELKPGLAESHGWIQLETKAASKEEFLLRLDLGCQLSDRSLQLVKEKGAKNPDIQITVADGLSAWAAERYAVPMVQELMRLCKENGYSVGTIFCVKYSRIAIQDVIGEAVGAKISMILLGERPGLGTGDSLSNYMVYGPKVGIVNAKKSMISNIHNNGHVPEAAAKLTLQMIKAMFEQKCSGVELKV